MRAVGSRSTRNLAILGALPALASIPIACAQGTVLTNPGTTGTGGSASTTTVVSVTSGTGGFGGGGTSIGGNEGSLASTTAQVSSSSGGPSSMCDGEASLGDCDTCVECANCTLCISQANACANSEACTNIVDCTGNCASGDTACLDACLSSNPSGEQAFNAYNLCLGCACQENCQVPASDCQ